MNGTRCRLIAAIYELFLLSAAGPFDVNQSDGEMSTWLRFSPTRPGWPRRLRFRVAGPERRWLPVAIKTRCGFHAPSRSGRKQKRKKRTHAHTHTHTQTHKKERTENGHVISHDGAIHHAPYLSVAYFPSPKSENKTTTQKKRRGNNRSGDPIEGSRVIAWLREWVRIYDVSSHRWPINQTAFYFGIEQVGWIFPHFT